MPVTCSGYHIILDFIILIILTELKLKEESSEMLRLKVQLCIVLQIGYFGKKTRNSLNVMKCGAGKG
jgi:archaellum biogenesis ATPase FlaH